MANWISGRHQKSYGLLYNKRIDFYLMPLFLWVDWRVDFQRLSMRRFASVSMRRLASVSMRFHLWLLLYSTPNRQSLGFQHLERRLEPSWPHCDAFHGCLTTVVAMAILLRPFRGRCGRTDAPRISRWSFCFGFLSCKDKQNVNNIKTFIFFMKWLSDIRMCTW